MQRASRGGWLMRTLKDARRGLRPVRGDVGAMGQRMALRGGGVLTRGATLYRMTGTCWLAEVAQLVEHLTENQGVPSSSLGLGTRAEVAQRVVSPA